MTTPKKNDPLSIAEMEEAADTFFPLFDIVHRRMQNRGGSVEDTLKVMESVAKLGHKNRADRRDKEKAIKFGFNKDDKTEEAEVQSQEKDN